MNVRFEIRIAVVVKLAVCVVQFSRYIPKVLQNAAALIRSVVLQMCTKLYVQNTATHFHSIVL